MNKYDSGYFISLFIKRIGWIFIIFSVAIGGFVYLKSPSGLGYVGWIVIFVGTFQGIMLLGFGSIAEAVLDIAEWQRKQFHIMESIRENMLKNYQVEKESASIKGNVGRSDYESDVGQSSNDGYRGWTIPPESNRGRK